MLILFLALTLLYDVKSACLLKDECHTRAKVSTKTAFISSTSSGSELSACFLGEVAVFCTFLQLSSFNGTEELHSSVSKPVVNFH